MGKSDALCGQHGMNAKQKQSTRNPGDALVHVFELLEPLLSELPVGDLLLY